MNYTLYTKKVFTLFLISGFANTLGVCVIKGN